MSNLLKDKYPELLKEWDYEKNKDLNLSKLLSGSNKKAFWSCNKNHSFEQVVSKRTLRGDSCPYCSGRKVGYGNDFESNFPNLAKEWYQPKNDKLPSEITPYSHYQAWWQCRKNENHLYKSRVSNRTKNKSGCNYCASKYITYDNNFKYLYPEIAKEWDYEKNEKQPENIFPNTDKKFWWICENLHSFEQKVSNRVQLGRGCPYCSNQKVGYGNDFNSNFPEIAKEWDYEKNEKQPEEFTKRSGKKVWWKCKKGHSWKATVDHRTSRNDRCPYCANKMASDQNNLLINFPEIAKEWDYEKNEKQPEEYVHGSNERVWWKCKEGHSWKTGINHRTRKELKCGFCSNKRVSSTNNLAYVRPDLLKEWDFKKNSTSPEQVTFQSHKKAWWKCKEGHSWSSIVLSRTRMNTGCPYCSNQLVSKTNNLEYLYPEIAKEWDYTKNKLNPNEATSQSSKKVWWVCKQGHSWFATIGSRTPSKVGKSKGVGCPYCTLTPRSREEVYLLFELKQFFNIDENNHKIKLKRVEDVDIKLANEKVVIEYDGAYWHKDKAERDKAKTKGLQKAGWTVIRVREKPLKVLSRKYNVSSKTGEYKETVNKVLKKLNQLGYQVKGLDKYLERKTLVNKKEAENYIDKLLKEKNYK